MFPKPDDRVPIDKFTEAEFESKSFEIQMHQKPAMMTKRYTYTAGKSSVPPKDGIAVKNSYQSLNDRYGQTR